MSYFEDWGYWYALFVLTGQEEKVRERLKYRFRDSQLRFIVPKRKLMERKAGKWEVKLRTLFPGYILANGYLGEKEYNLLKGVPGLLRVLKENGEPYEIPEKDMEAVKMLIGNGEIIDQSNIFEKSGKVVIVDGPLLGLEGFIHSIDKRKSRAKISISFAGESRLIDLSICIIQPN